MQTISSIMLSIVYFIIGLSVFSYGLAMLSIGQSLMFVTFKKLSDDDLIFRTDEDEDDDDNNDLKSQNIFESKLEKISEDSFY